MCNCAFICKTFIVHLFSFKRTFVIFYSVIWWIYCDGNWYQSLSFSLTSISSKRWCYVRAGHSQKAVGTLFRCSKKWRKMNSKVCFCHCLRAKMWSCSFEIWQQWWWGISLAVGKLFDINVQASNCVRSYDKTFYSILKWSLTVVVSASVSFKERAPSPPRSEKMASAASNKGKGKDKGKAAKEKDKGSRPPSQQFDFTKPNWTLRIISDGTAMVWTHQGPYLLTDVS